MRKLEKQTPRAIRDRVAELMRTHGEYNQALRYEYCREPGRGWVGVCVHDPDHQVIYHPESCGLRICPDCARRRSAELAGQLEQPLIDLEARSPGAYRLRHVVLTTGLDLNLAVDVLRYEIRTLRVAAREVFQECFPDDRWLGGGIGAEFGEAGHKLHFHCLVLSRWLPSDQIRSLWSDKTGGRFYVVKFRSDLDTHQAIREVTKYITKPLKDDDPSEDDVSLLVKLHLVLKGIRRFVTFGSFYRLPRDERDDVQLCPDCGAAVIWIGELEWIESAYQPGRNLTIANKSPPEEPKNDTETGQLNEFSGPVELPGI